MTGLTKGSLKRHSSLAVRLKDSTSITDYLPHPQRSEPHTCVLHHTALPMDIHLLSWNAQSRMPQSLAPLGLLVPEAALDALHRYDGK